MTSDSDRDGGYNCGRFEVGIAGLSSLKYAYATYQGFDSIPIVQPSNKCPIARSFKELSQ